MHPLLIEIGGYSIKTYGFFVATAFLAGITLAMREAKRAGRDPQFVLDLSFYIIVGAIVGSRLFYVLTHLSYYRGHVLDAFKIWEGGLTFFGGFIMALLLCIWIIRRRGMGTWETFDIFAPSLAAGVFFGRIGCFFAGCCYGTSCSLPWAVTFTNPHSLARLNTPLHPVQLYSAGGALITFLVLYAIRTRKSFDGQLAVLWVFLYSGFRSINELFRGDVRGDLLFERFPTSQVLAWCLLAASVILYPVLCKINKKR